MKRLRMRFTLPILGLALAAGLWAGFGAGAGSGAVKVIRSSKGTTIVVTAGKPSELAFKLSKISNIPAGPVTFKVTNQGVAYHDFKLCMTPVATTAKNACTGKGTAILHHGQSATLTVTLTKTGTYEFLCSVTGHAAAGMKGLLGIGVVVKAQPPTTTTTPATSTPTTTGKTTTTTPTSTSGGTHDSGCAPGVTIQSSGASDADGDEAGTEPDDNDGCI